MCQTLSRQDKSASRKSRPITASVQWRLENRERPRQRRRYLLRGPGRARHDLPQTVRHRTAAQVNGPRSGIGIIVRRRRGQRGRGRKWGTEAGTAVEDKVTPYEVGTGGVTRFFRGLAALVADGEHAEITRRSKPENREKHGVAAGVGDRLTAGPGTGGAVPAAVIAVRLAGARGGVPARPA